MASFKGWIKGKKVHLLPCDKCGMEAWTPIEIEKLESCKKCNDE
tara:strand:+ start:1828 stop:1959 length:132 start_codon:yes stop_codon:yes gene_type:complete